MSVEARIAMEKRIVRKIATDAIELGYFVSVFDGEETTVKRSQNVKAIMDAVMTTDDDRLYFSKGADQPNFGWVYLVYGNCGWEVVNDYTINIEDIMAGANKLAEKLEKESA